MGNLMNTNVRMRLAALFFAFSAFISSCSSNLTHEQCVLMDWFQEGYQDGYFGIPQRNLSQSMADCAKYNVTVKVGQYEKGWRNGISQYCKPDNAYRAGVHGKVYHNTCPVDLNEQFLKSWNKGLLEYCIPKTGYNLGRDGKDMPQFCSLAQLNRFRNAYDEGRREYEAEQKRQAQLDDMNQKIAEIYESAKICEHDIHTVREISKHISRQ